MSSLLPSTSSALSQAACSPMASSPLHRRLRKELAQLVNEPPAGVTLASDCENNFRSWRVTLDGAQNTVYEGERFVLQFVFPDQYPFSAPQVMFSTEAPVPVHPHIYSNGHICLSILHDDWSPAMCVQSICISIISMLSSCKDKKRPVDDAIYVRTCDKNPKKTRWWFHDDSV